MSVRQDSSDTPNLVPRRRQLRQAPSDAESALWYYLRDRRLEGAKFRRQHQIGPYFVDFYCMKARLAIEVDGSQHYSSEGLAADAIRSKFLSNEGVNVLRFTNVDVLTNIDGVMEMIRVSMQPSPSPPPSP